MSHVKQVNWLPTGNDKLMTCDFDKMMFADECLSLSGSGVVWLVEVGPPSVVQTGFEITRLLNQPCRLES